jgi:tetratricopeptide (TPR) repeat protein
MKRLSSALLIAVLFVFTATWAQAPTSQAQTAGRRPAQAKTQAEYKDYNTAYTISGGAAVEKAANDFAAKYPDSELRSYLYSKALHEYQNENNPGKMLAMGEKILALDPDNSIALVLTATVLSDSLTDSDADRQQKIAEIKKNANRALQTVNTGFAPPPNTTPEQVAAYKSTLQSMAHSALGIMNLKMGDDAGAEQELKTAADLNKTQPDPYIWYHLALAQDHQQKYAEALKSIDEALRTVGSNADLGKLAAGERERLLKLAGNGTPGGNKSEPPQ